MRSWQQIPIAVMYIYLLGAPPFAPLQNRGTLLPGVYSWCVTYHEITDKLIGSNLPASLYNLELLLELAVTTES